ncbi:MAG: phenylacetate--CoA ligase family protein [Pelosinus sp.]|nr:phenylacetate--CoA ligase family protein [Pelosinus sp.]
MFLNQSIEQLPRPELSQLQTASLKTMLTRVYEKSPFYEKRMTELGIHPADVHSLADIGKLPFTTKAELMQNYPYGLLTMPVSGVARFQTAEGIALGLTGQDVYQQIETVARSLVACNIIRGSMVMPLSPAAACHSVQQAAEGIGVTVLDSAFAAAEAQLAALSDFGVTALCGTKEDLQQFADTLRKSPALESHLSIKSLLICTAEYPLSTAFTNQFKVPIYTLYGSNDLAPASLAGECHCQTGLHVHEDSFYVEIIDTATNRSLPAGQPGELVVTTLTREAMPLLRYRTGALAILDNSPCPCGRSAIRITQIK